MASAVEIELRGPVNLEATLECGQAFRWRRATFAGRPDLSVSYLGVIPLCPGGARTAAQGKTACRAAQSQFAALVGQSEKVTDRFTVAFDVTLRGCLSPEDVRRAALRYFSSEDDLPAWERELSNMDPVLAAAIAGVSGLRVLQQDPWECLASFILSARNRVPNIAAVVDRLAERLGHPAGFDLCGFPPPEVLARRGAAFFRGLGCGFRDRYLRDAAEKVASREVDLDLLRGMLTGEAREALQKIAGVGPKVADCVLLFAYHRLDVFPVDVWIARAVSTFYFGGRSVTTAAAREEGLSRFGSLAGYAQEHLFHHVRRGN